MSFKENIEKLDNARENLRTTASRLHGLASAYLDIDPSSFHGRELREVANGIQMDVAALRAASMGIVADVVSGVEQAGDNMVRAALARKGDA